MTATESQVSCHLLRKFGSESRPPPMLRRDERIRSMASSFEEITESEEEEAQAVTPSFSMMGKSPYAMQSESPFSQRRSNSLTHNPLVSPKFAKRVIPPRLMRGFSDPVMRRKSSLTSLIMHSPDRLSHDNMSGDLLSLPPIPEAATPASPVSAPPTIFRDNNVNDNDNSLNNNSMEQ